MQTAPNSGPADSVAQASSNEPVRANTSPSKLGTITLPKPQKRVGHPGAARRQVPAGRLSATIVFIRGL